MPALFVTINFYALIFPIQIGFFSRRIRSYRNISKALSEATERIFLSTGYIILIEMQMKRCPFGTYLFYLTSRLIFEIRQAAYSDLLISYWLWIFIAFYNQ